MTSDEIVARYVKGRGDPTHDLLLQLLGGPKGDATSDELDRLLAEARRMDAELALDAKRSPAGDRSNITPGAPHAQAKHHVDAMVADGSGGLHTNKETPT